MLPEPPARGTTMPILHNATLRPLLVLGLDGLITVGCLWIAMLLRFEGTIPESYALALPTFTTLLVGYRLLANLLFRLHRWSFRFSGLADGARVAMAGVGGTGLLLTTFFLVRHPGLPRSVVVLELLLSTLFMAAVRFSRRLAGLYIGDWTRKRRPTTLRTLIVGAGAAGEMLLRDLQRSQYHQYHVVGFVDDDPGKRNHVVSGKAVLGSIDELARIVRENRATQLLIAIPRLEARRIREILSQCSDLKLRFKILPVSFVYLQQRAAAAAMQDLSPADLLPREAVTFADARESIRLEKRTAFVTGAAGSIGSEICSQLLQAGLSRLVMLDVNENGLYLTQRSLERLFPDAEIHVEVGNIQDASRIDSLFELYRPHDLFHAAAHKHVPLMEGAPCEAVKNNIQGTWNVARAADQVGVERFVYISTDKAVRPTSVMGVSKRVGEKLIRFLAQGSSTRYCAVRFGNVLGSAGSVVPIFREQIARGGPVTVTHPEVRRYFMTISEAVALVLTAGYGDYGKLCVLDMGEQIKILELARHMITMAGHVPDVDIAIELTGLRPGEKLFEELLTEDEERTHRVADKIFVADSPELPEEFRSRIEELVAGARLGVTPKVLRILGELVPSYAPVSFEAPVASTKPRDASAQSA